MGLVHDRENAFPERDILVDKDVVHAGGGKISLCSGVHVDAAAEANRKKEDVGVASWR